MEVRAEVAQVVEHGTENAGVDSSSLSLGTFLCFRGCYVRKWRRLPTFMVKSNEKMMVRDPFTTYRNLTLWQ